MIVFIDPQSMQVMAVYSGDTTSTGWQDQGYVRKAVPEECQADVQRHARDSKVTLGRDGDIVGCVANVNPVQPTRLPPTRLDDLRAKLRADTIDDAEVREMLRLERGL
mgnify:CR=1 FL=1